MEFQARSVANLFDEVHVLHCDEWKLPEGSLSRRVIRRRFDSLVGAIRPQVTKTDYGWVHRLPILIDAGSTYGQSAVRHRETVARAYADLIDGAEVVHGHVGLPSGWTSVQVSRRHQRTFTSEHATYLHRMFKQTDSRAAYESMIREVTSLLPVSSALRDVIADWFPWSRDRMSIVPNVVPFEQFKLRPNPPTRLDSWLYVGSLQERKGIRTLLEAFAIVHMDRPHMRLTIVGSGPLETDLKHRVEELGLGTNVTFRRPVLPSHMPNIYAAHDLLVHAATYETFGMTVVEAVASGIPVLVTDSRGPRDTVGPIIDLCGVMVPPSSSPTELVAGFRRLQAKVDSLDLLTARADLKERFGQSIVKQRFAQIYFD